MSSEVKVVGTVNAGPSNPAGTTMLSSFLDLGLDHVYSSVDSGNIAVAGTNNAPYLLGASFSAINFVAIRSVDGASLKILASSALGADQAIPFSDELVVHVPNAGDQFTALKIVGTGRVEFFIAGT